MRNQLLEIRRILKGESDFAVKTSTKKFVPTVRKNYGVKVPILNELTKKFKNGGFKLVKALWKSGVYEEMLLASKILGEICKQNPEKTLDFVKRFSEGISDWAVCDTLATQGIRKIAKEKQKELLELSRRYVLSKNLWQRRFGLVILINFAKDENVKKNIEAILAKVENDKEPYVKKAVTWLKSKLK